MRYTKRTPDFSVRIFRPGYNGGRSRDIVTFVSGAVGPGADGYSDGLLAYDFTEDLANPEGQFSLRITPDKDRNGRTWADKIETRDVVVISEFRTVRFVGLVSEVSHTARMSETPNRSISITGSGLGGFLQSFSILLNPFVLQGSQTASAVQEELNQALTAALAEDQRLGPALKLIWDRFFELMFEVGEMVPGGRGARAIPELINRYFNFDRDLSDDVRVFYPVVFTLLDGGPQDVWSILQRLVPSPLYELFGRWESEIDQFSIHLRHTPFTPDRWVQLPVTTLDPIHITDTHLRRSDADAYTAFFAQLPEGSAIGRNQSLANPEYREAISIDYQRFSKYGWRPLELVFEYFDRDEVMSYSSGGLMLERTNEMLRQFFEKVPEYLSGTVKMMTVADAYVRIGERIRLLRGDFYVTGTKRSWTYGGPMESSLTIDRGCQRDDSGEDIGPLQFSSFIDLKRAAMQGVI